VISGLGTGGAEQMLLRLTEHMPRTHFVPTVLALRGGPMRDEFLARGVEVVDAGLTGLKRLPHALGAITNCARRVEPDVVHGWMNHGNLAAWYAQRAVPRRARLVWGVRQSLYDIRLEKAGTRYVIRAEARLSRKPDAIVFNSAVGLEQHRAAGFRNARMEVIDNGFDTTLLCPDPIARAAMRQELGVPQDAEVIGFVGRAHKMKDAPTFFAALSRVLSARPRAWAIAVGRGVPALEPLVAAHIGSPERARVVLLEERRELNKVYPALDVLCSTSLHGEGFPNVVAEAMACEVPCVVTDVGDSRRVVGDTGTVVQRSDVAGVAAALLAMLQLGTSERTALGRAARARVQANYSIEAVVARHRQLYDSLMETHETA
jgi:glycosyltransferase involved in cell wall biosynthesis